MLLTSRGGKRLRQIKYFKVYQKKLEKNYIVSFLIQLTNIQLKKEWYTGLVPELYIRKPNSACLICKKKIYRRPAEIEKAKGRLFCSMVCYGISCRKEISCIVCGKLILAGFNKKTCSRGCANKNRIGIQYTMNRPRDKVVSLFSIKKRLLETRGEHCERCNYSKSQVLQVHHKNRNSKDNNLKNLELICPNCHYEEHYLKEG